MKGVRTGEFSVSILLRQLSSPHFLLHRSIASGASFAFTPRPCSLRQLQPLRAMPSKGRKKQQVWKEARAGSEKRSDPPLSTPPSRVQTPPQKKLETSPPDPKTVWVPKATLTTSAVNQAPAQAAVMEAETSYPVKKGQLKIKSEVRATFYPKFENEKSDQEIRSRMIDVVHTGKGVVEVSLKHSGSLFMYAGDGAAFAKNSYGNLYTAVGVYVLGKTLEQAWGKDYKAKQREFNEYLKKKRMSISMELVTAVLGDHGQRPLKDYVVVTAVTELTGRPRFFSTPDLIKFCRTWRLPTNEVWLFSTRKSASACFAAYDVLCEQSIYSVVRDNFNKIADTYVQGTESHSVVQGEILEGLVARIVSSESVKQLKEVAEKYPVPDHVPGAYSAPGLREICAANRQSEREQSKALLKAVGLDFCSDWSAWSSRNKDIGTQNTCLNKLLQTPPADDPTAKLQEMVKLIRNKKMSVKFKCQAPEGSENEFTMTIHVIQDSVFRRYQKEMQNNPSLWPLYRGFFVDCKLSKDSSSSKSEAGEATNGMQQTGSLEQDAMADDAEHLMVKLKFLTYKIRTFLIRNGLEILFNRGHQPYRDYYFRQMKIWGTSAGKQKELSKLLDEWAVHITKKFKGKLKEGSYLTEAEPFLKEFASRSQQNQLLVGQAGTNIDTAAYMAAIRFGDDEEGDLKQDITGDMPITQEQGIKAKGMLVFFPGIPGCAKSALCKELLSTPGGFGDNRPVKTLMGDLIKARYWPKIAEERAKDPRVITLADKNAPNEEVWRMITDICKDTDALAVPVIPDSEGTDSNPFSLDALAVFIFRVLHREKHPGNLDKNSPYPGYVLMMFYHLYDGKDRGEFEESLRQRYGYLVKAPLLKPNRQPLPQEITSVLQEGIQLFGKHSSKHGRADPQKGSYKREWDDWENKLKKVLAANSKYINDIQVPFEEVVSSVREQLRDVVTGKVDVHMPPQEERKFRKFNYAAVTLPVDGIFTALSKLSSSSAELRTFLAPKQLEKSLRAAHITLAHIRSHGIPAVAEFGAFVGSEVPCKLTALLYCPRMCALEAHIDSDSIASKNPFTHVTLWTAPGTPPKEAGTLANLVSKGQASRVEFPQPVVLNGKVEFKM